MDRTTEFEKIKKIIQKNTRHSNSRALVAEGDSLDLLRKIPSQSVSLILTDPPYHSTKKDNIHGDTSFKEDVHYIEWMIQYIKEWKRIIKPNGSIFCFCSPTMSARLEIVFSEEFNILSQVVWTKPNDPGFDGWKQKMKKESLRQWYPHTERIIFAEPSHEGNLNKSYFGNLLREMRKLANLSGHQLTAMTGAHGRVNHGGAVSNWEAGRNIPSREQYKKICDALMSTGKINYIPDYEDSIRPFKVDASREFTDVWTFPSVRPFKGKHPAEKPLAMLEHAIEATTYPNDIVLDCFSGSGNTGVAALKLGRRAILMEIDPIWISRSASAIEIAEKIDSSTIKNNIEITRRSKMPQSTLFAY